MTYEAEFGFVPCVFALLSQGGLYLRCEVMSSASHLPATDLFSTMCSLMLFKIESDVLFGFL